LRTLRLRRACGQRERQTLTLSGIVGPEDRNQVCRSHESRLDSNAPLIWRATWAGKRRVQTTDVTGNAISAWIEEDIESRPAKKVGDWGHAETAASPGAIRQSSHHKAGLRKTFFHAALRP